MLAANDAFPLLAEYRDKMFAWYKDTCADDSEETDTTDKLGFKQWLRVCKDGSSANTSKETAERNASYHMFNSTLYEECPTRFSMVMSDEFYRWKPVHACKRL